MKSHSCLPMILAAVFAVAAPVSVTAAPPAPATKLPRPELPKSVFVIPASPQEGRDPFFPNSVRVYTENPANKRPTVQMPTVADLQLKSIYTSEDGRDYAMINNHTVGPGDDATVKTSTGPVNIHCRSINKEKGTVTVDANGAIIVLTVAHGQ